MLLCGDMFQFPPVMPPTPLYTSVVKLLGKQPDSNRKKAQATTREINSAEENGVRLFLQFQKVELQQQMRAAGDPQHMRVVNEMRKENPNMVLVCQQLEKEYHQLNSDLLKQDHEFFYCPIACTGNRERAVINDSVSKAFARKHGLPRIIWNQPLVGHEIVGLKQSTIDSIYLHYPEFTSYFVVGAPAMLNNNICCKRHLANGTPVTFHSLIIDNKEGEHVVDQIAHAAPGEDIYLQRPPLYINVSVDDANFEDYIDLTLVNEEAVIPVGPNHAASRATVYVPEYSRGIKVESVGHGVDLRFGITMHKVQGKTVKRVCAELNEHPFPPKVNYHGVFVTISRVKTSQHLALLPYPSGQTDLHHLRDLKPPKNLILWLKSYDTNGWFDRDLLLVAMNKNKKINKGKRLKEKQSVDSSPPKKKKKN